MNFVGSVSAPSPEHAAATSVSKIAAGARRNTCSKNAGFAVEPIVTAVFGIEPGDLGRFEFGRIGIDGGFPVIDHNPPRRAAHRVDAGDRGLALLRVAVDGRNGQTRSEAGHLCH